MRMEAVMATSRGKKTGRPGKRRKANSANRPKNLSLDAEALERGEEYGRRHGVALSHLVGEFLRALPLDAPEHELTPVVQRLYGVATEGGATRDDYREHLYRKYGRR
jgi:hypothetical protein